MRKIIFIATVVFLLNFVALANPKSDLMNLLPDSNAVIRIDAQRLVNEVLPQILAENPQKLAEMQGLIETIKTKSGIDVRQIEQIVVGVNFINEKNADAVALLETKFNANEVLLAGKTIFAGKYREETIGGRTVYVFSIKENDLACEPKNSKRDKLPDLILGGKDEVAVTALDSKVIAVGSLSSVRATIERKSQVKPEIASFLYSKPNVIMALSAQMPRGLSDFVQLDDDDFGKALASVRQIYGWADFVNGKIMMSLIGKAENDKQAQTLVETLTTFQTLFTSVLRSMSGRDKQVYAKMLNDLKISGKGQSVELYLEVPKSYLSVLF